MLVLVAGKYSIAGLDPFGLSALLVLPLLLVLAPVPVLLLPKRSRPSSSVWADEGDLCGALLNKCWCWCWCAGVGEARCESILVFEDLEPPDPVPSAAAAIEE